MEANTDKKEVLSITPGIWKESENSHEFKITSDKGGLIASIIPDHTRIFTGQCRDNFKAICNAVNNTYNKNINPESVEGLYNALEEMIRMYEEVQPAGGWQGVYEEAKHAINNAKLST